MPLEFRRITVNVTGNAPIRIEYVPRTALTAHNVAPERSLAAVSFGGLEPPQPYSPVVVVPLPQLGDVPYIELWSCATPVERGRFEDVEYAADGEVLFGACRRTESAGTSLDELTYAVYADVMRTIRATGYPQLLRVWNYVADLNGRQGGEERYHRFCRGRYRALIEFNPDVEQTLPAASVIGSHVPEMTIYFLAAHGQGTPVENPRQLSAYRYPTQYSPQSPSFSRAMLKVWPDAAHLYVSGTASIVGHSTLHGGDVRRQLQEILRNLQALLAAASRTAGTEFPGVGEASVLKAYVRRADDLPLVKDALTQAMGQRASVLYLQGDLCRSDLLVEIEGIYATS